MNHLPTELMVKIAEHLRDDFVSLSALTDTCQTTRNVLADAENDFLWKNAARDLCFYIDKSYGGSESWRMTCYRLWKVVGEPQKHWCHVEDNSVVKRYWDMRIDKGSIYTMGLKEVNTTTANADADDKMGAESDDPMNTKRRLLCGGTFANAAQLNTLDTPPHNTYDVVNRKTAPVAVLPLGNNLFGLIVKFNNSGNNMTASLTDFTTWRFDLEMESDFQVSGLVMLVHCALVDPDGTGHFVFSYTASSGIKKTLLICQTGQQELSEADLRNTELRFPPKWFVPTRSFINSFSRISASIYCLYLQTNIAIFDCETGEIWNCFHGVSNWNATVVFCGPWVVLAIDRNVYVNFLAKKLRYLPQMKETGDAETTATRKYRTPLARRVSNTIRHRFEEEDENWAVLLVKKRININRTFEDEVLLSTENTYQKYIYLHRPFQETDHVFLDVETMEGIKIAVQYGTKEVAVDEDMRVYERR
ncbi:YALIA101S10e01464g1_1 [Yarrowia lipolytica]|nr:Hypothetical protein YALI2_A00665g [Yarrowia lipolytica]SEI36131.1 YALIA101S10e01464g1_1 [Yarrowia lipolytica]